jgi:hypothetical protein
LAKRVVANNPGFRGPAGPQGGNVLAIPSKTSANGTSVPSGTTLTQTADYSGNGVGQSPYSANTPNAAQVLAKHPRAAYTAADGRVFAKVKGIPSITEFGAVGDNATDDYPAIWAAVEWCTEYGEPELLVPRGQFYCSQTFNIDKALTVRGTGTGRAGANISKSILRFPESVTAFDIHSAITSPRAGQAGVTGADGSRILGLKLIGGPNSTTSKAIRMRARTEVAQDVIEYFGTGVDITVAAGSGGQTEGNANHWSVHDCRIDTARGHGLVVQRSDSNAGAAYDLDIAGCNGFGVLGNPFLATMYWNIQTAGCGTFAGRRGGTFAGANYQIDGTFHFFTPRYDATPQQLGANAPTLANDNIWMHVYAGANPAFPVWQSGGTDYAPGGAYAFDGPVTATSMYAESDSAPAQVHGVAELRNGTQAAGVVGRGGIFYVAAGGAQASRRGFIAIDPTMNGRYAAVGDALAIDKWMEFFDPTLFPNELAWKLNTLTELGLTHGTARLLAVSTANAAVPNQMRLYNPLLTGGPYADDLAASSGGVRVGEAYRKTGGTIAWRAA